MAQNSRKHTIPAGTETSVRRETIFETFGNTISDIVPVANATDRGAVVTDLTADGVAPSSSRPLTVLRADADGLHRLEYSYDGSVFLPASGRLKFDTTAAADSWGAANGGLLAPGDVAMVAGIETRWSGTAWQHVTTLTLATGWAQAGSQHTPRLHRMGNMVWLFGGVTGSGAASVSNIASIPVGWRPSDPATRFVGSGVTSGGISYELVISSGTLAIPPGYSSASIPLGQAIPFVCSWVVG